MSAAPGQKSSSSSKTDSKEATTTATASKPTTSALEEDDEFEDFPVEGMCPTTRFDYWPARTMAHTRVTRLAAVEDWTQEETEVTGPGASDGGTAHLWEESWDDDDTNEDFSAQLKYACRCCPAPRWRFLC